jgi:hypothetical protein
VTPCCLRQVVNAAKPPVPAPPATVVDEGVVAAVFAFELPPQAARATAARTAMMGTESFLKVRSRP